MPGETAPLSDPTKGPTDGTGGADRDWWKQAAVYQIYPRSFADANGDGIGDLQGIIDRIPYLERLGVDAVWLCPFYPSPLNDGGYDVADFRDVDPRIGTLADFEAMTQGFAKAGIKVLVDIVPNHASSDHPWFKEALQAAPGSPERNRFHFIKGKGSDGSSPPNDWESTFGGPAWTYANHGEWYLHLYDSTQPDFNWDCKDVQEDFESTLRFWADRGVDGFRVDVAHGCAKDLSPEMLALPWEKVKAMRAEMSKPGGKWQDSPIHDRNETLEFFKSWRKIMNSYDPPLTGVAEAFVAPERQRLYASPEGLGQTFSFDLMFCNFDAEEYRQVISRQMENGKNFGTGATWVVSTHDVVRHPSRYGLPPNPADTLQPFTRFYQEWTVTKGQSMECDFERGLRRARAASLMMMALPGSCYMYQGEELGLPQVLDIPDDQIQDPRFFRSDGADRGRDGCRVPLPWTTSSSDNFGFSSNATKSAHLPQPGWWGDYSVDSQSDKGGSTLDMYRRALHLRKELQAEATLQWSQGYDQRVLAFERPGGWRVILNASKEKVKLPDGMEVLVASDKVEDGYLASEAAVWLR